MMMKLIIWIMISYGLMNIMVYGSIFQGLRDFFNKWGSNPRAPLQFFGDFISGVLGCPMCFSFHGGWVLSLLIFSPTSEFLNTPVTYSWFFDGILSSGMVWAINSIIEWFEENRTNNNNQL